MAELSVNGVMGIAFLIDLRAMKLMIFLWLGKKVASTA